MKATISRLGHGSYFATFAVNNQRGAVGFKIESAGQNSWVVVNQHDTELNNWTTKKSMVDWLQSRTEQQLIDLATKQ